jgi:hypothetical protein
MVRCERGSVMTTVALIKKATAHAHTLASAALNLIEKGAG